MSLSVDFERVTVQFDNRTALSDLSLHPDGGKIYGLLGRNGAGKSTMLSLLGALRKPTSGSVLVDGQELFENYELTRQVTLVREAPDVLDTDEKLDYNLEFAAQMRSGWDESYARELVQKFATRDYEELLGLWIPALSSLPDPYLAKNSLFFKINPCHCSGTSSSKKIASHRANLRAERRNRCAHPNHEILIDIIPRMNAIDRTNLDARRVLRANARLCDDIRHLTSSRKRESTYAVRWVRCFEDARR